MANGVSIELVRESLKQMSSVYMEGRDVFLLDEYVQNVHDWIGAYLKEYPNYTFVGVPHLAESQAHVALDFAHPAFWKDSTTLDWKITPTGRSTFDELFPETASYYIRLDTQTTPHWAKLCGYLEIGSANNILRVSHDNINGKKRGRVSRFLESRVSQIKAMKIKPALDFGNRGQIDIGAEFETVTPTEIAPLAIHLLPFEILVGEISGYVTATA